MAAIVPGVTAPVGRMMRTRSPTVTVGEFDGLRGTVTTRVVLVTWYGTSPGDAWSPGATDGAPTSTEPGRNSTRPGSTWPVTGSPAARCQRSTAADVAQVNWSRGVLNSPAA